MSRAARAGNAMRRDLPVLVALLLWALPASLPAAEAGDEAPAFVLADHSGEPVDFPAAAAGRPSVLFFWATWCPYCKAVMPYLDEIRREFAASGVAVFAVNIKEDGDPQAFAAESGYDFRWLADGDAVAEAYAVRYTPGLLVVDGDGTIVYRRPSTDLPPGRKVAEYWAEQLTAALEKSLVHP